MNQSRASSAAARRVPGSSNRWVAPGTTASRFSQRSRAWAWRLSSSTIVVAADDQQRGGRDRGEAWPGEIGTAPRETTAAMSAPGSVAAHSAAAAPVLAPK